MSSSCPVVIMAFSNSKDKYLENIESERAAISEALLQYEDELFLQTREISHTTPEDLFQKVNRYTDQLAIFHFAGHADGASIDLETEFGAVKKARSVGISGLLGLQNKLQLVFLNGCATKGHVRSLLKHDVKAVIATSVAINDPLASKFAQRFYHSMGTGDTLKEAFLNAKAFVEQDPHNTNQIVDPDQTYAGKEGSRGDLILTNKSKEFPWGFYYLEKNKAVLDWRLETISYAHLKSGEAVAAASPENINRLIVNGVFKAIRKFSGPAQDLVSKAKAIREKTGDDKYSPKRKKFREAIIESYPPPVGPSIRKFFSLAYSSSRNYKRYVQVLRTCHLAVRFCSLVFLSQLWEEFYTRKKKNENIADIFDMSPANCKALESFFHTYQKDQEKVDFFILLLQLLDIFSRNKIQPFLSEQDPGNQNDTTWSIAVSKELAGIQEFLLEKHLELIDPTLVERLEGTCQEAEQKMTQLLTIMKGLTRYKLATVKYVELIKKRHHDSQLKHIIVELDNNNTDSGRDDESVNIATTKDTESVMVYPDFPYSDKSKGLNLSPFIIDQNALNPRKPNSNVFLFDYFDDEDQIHFLHIEHGDNKENKLIISDENYVGIKSLLLTAKQDLTGQETTIKPVKEEDLIG